MWVKNYYLSKIYNFNLFDPFFIQQRKTESNVSRMLSFLPFKILKASRVCESRLLAIPWLCHRYSVAHERTTQSTLLNHSVFLKQKCPFPTRHKTGTSFSQHSAN